MHALPTRPGYSGGRAPSSGHLWWLCGYQSSEAWLSRAERECWFHSHGKFFMFTQSHVIRGIIAEVLHFKNSPRHHLAPHWRLTPFTGRGKRWTWGSRSKNRRPLGPTSGFFSAASLANWTRAPAGWRFKVYTVYVIYWSHRQVFLFFQNLTSLWH